MPNISFHSPPFPPYRQRKHSYKSNDANRVDQSEQLAWQPTMSPLRDSWQGLSFFFLLLLDSFLSDFSVLLPLWSHLFPSMLGLGPISMDSNRTQHPCVVDLLEYVWIKKKRMKCERIHRHMTDASIYDSTSHLFFWSWETVEKKSTLIRIVKQYSFIFFYFFWRALRLKRLNKKVGEVISAIFEASM